MANTAGIELDPNAANSSAAKVDTSKKVRIGIVGTGWIADAHIAFKCSYNSLGFLHFPALFIEFNISVFNIRTCTPSYRH